MSDLGHSKALISHLSWAFFQRANGFEAEFVVSSMARGKALRFLCTLAGPTGLFGERPTIEV